MKKFRRFRLKSKKTTVDVPLIDFESIIAEILKTREEELDSPKTFVDLERIPQILGWVDVNYPLRHLEPGWSFRMLGNSAQLDAVTIPEESGQ